MPTKKITCERRSQAEVLHCMPELKISLQKELRRKTLFIPFPNLAACQYCPLSFASADVKVNALHNVEVST